MVGFARYALFAALALGCAGGNSTGTVRGTVTLDGQPLKDGMVKFIPADSKAQPITAAVKEGQFTLTAPVGVNRVEFSVAKVVGKIKMYETPDSPTVDQTKEMLPEKFNVKSELKTTVNGGSQDETYTLTSK
jgi:hypothetical protein